MIKTKEANERKREAVADQCGWTGDGGAERDGEANLYSLWKARHSKRVLQ